MLDAALRKAGAVWVSAGGRPARLVWTVWGCPLPPAGEGARRRENALWLLTGAGEQEVPGLADGARCTVVLRSPSTHSRLAELAAVAHAVTPEDAEWDAALATLAAARLNAPGDAAARWADATIYRLDPVPA